MKIRVVTTTLERGVAVATETWTEKIGSRSCVPFGLAELKMRNGKPYILIEEPQEYDARVLDEVMPYQMFNGKRVHGFFETIFQPGDVLVVHFASEDDPSLVHRQLVMLESE